MSYFTKEKLLSAIKDHTTLIELDSGESSVIISEYSGRPIGIFPKDNIYNLLWVNPNIKKAIESRSHEIGGIGTGLAQKGIFSISSLRHLKNGHANRP